MANTNYLHIQLELAEKRYIEQQKNLEVLQKEIEKIRESIREADSKNKAEYLIKINDEFELNDKKKQKEIVLNIVNSYHSKLSSSKNDMNAKIDIHLI